MSSGNTGTRGIEASGERERLLMGRVAEGDREAFPELFDRVAPCILGVLVRLLSQRSLAEEALQETFLQGWLQAGRYRPELASPRAWLLSIARSRGLDTLRRERSRIARELAMPLGTVKSRIRLGMRRLGGMLASA